jgi:spore germination protein YaaH
MNPGCDQTLYAGQRLRIPKSNASSESGQTFHTIQAGETLYRLTVIYNVSAKSILDANPGLSADNFRIGQVVRIPNASGASTATADAPEAFPMLREHQQPLLQLRPQQQKAMQAAVSVHR